MHTTRLLIVYATTDGQTARIARRIADVAGIDADTECRIYDVGEVRPEAIGWCNRVILAASVHFGRHQRAMLKFVRRHGDALSALPSAFVSVSGASSSPKTAAEAARYTEDFMRRSGWRPERIETVAGAYLYTRYNALVRFMVRRSAALSHLDTDTRRDFEYTDWDQVDRFTREFASGMASKVA
ncbi:MAG TPA: flavodoxin domain-containing protein [Thermoanaerobaculia bacterium]|nr:flavodoxin domain-containing protein [Thermoanaerobaculia bacterium]